MQYRVIRWAFEEHPLLTRFLIDRSQHADGSYDYSKIMVLTHLLGKQGNMEFPNMPSSTLSHAQIIGLVGNELLWTLHEHVYGPCIVRSRNLQANHAATCHFGKPDTMRRQGIIKDTFSRCAGRRTRGPVLCRGSLKSIHLSLVMRLQHVRMPIVQIGCMSP